MLNIFKTPFLKKFTKKIKYLVNLIIFVNSMVKIDVKDKKILYQLVNNSRQSLHSIGKKVGLSREVVGYRLKRFEDEGIIQNYVTLLRMGIIGLSCIRYYYVFQFISPEIKEKIINHFVKSPNTFYVGETEGSYDLQVNIYSYLLKDPEIGKKFIAFYDDTQKKYREYFENQIGYAFLESETFDLVFLLNEPLKFPTKARFDLPDDLPVKIDDMDMKILKILATNARMPTIEIAKTVKTTVTTVKNRIKKYMNAGIILKFSAHIDWMKIGYRPFLIEISLKNYVQKYEIMEHIRKNPNIFFIMQTLGRNVDLEFEFILRNVTELHQIIKDLSSRFPESIKNYKYFSTLKIHKWNHIPLPLKY